MRLGADGAELFPSLASDMLPALESTLAAFPSGKAGMRITDCAPLASLLAADMPIGALLQSLLGSAVRPVRAILFDKNPNANWALDWHQDRTIAVREKRDVTGFKNWNSKQGIRHVEPPFSLLETMLTARIHLDPVNGENGVLEVVAGSHGRGRIAEGDIGNVVSAGPIRSCPAQAADVWLYRTPVLHRSARSGSDGRRRVLQVDFSADQLPGGLEWRGI